MGVVCDSSDILKLATTLVYLTDADCVISHRFFGPKAPSEGHAGWRKREKRSFHNHGTLGGGSTRLSLKNGVNTTSMSLKGQCAFNTCIYIRPDGFEGW